MSRSLARARRDPRGRCLAGWRAGADPQQSFPGDGCGLEIIPCSTISTCPAPNPKAGSGNHDLIGASGPRYWPCRRRKAPECPTCSRRSGPVPRHLAPADARFGPIFDSYYYRYRGGDPELCACRRPPAQGMRSGRRPPRRRVPCDEVGYLHYATSNSGSRPREVGYLVPPRQFRDSGRRHHLSTRTTPPPSCCPATATSNRWCSPGSIRPTPISTGTARALEKLVLNTRACSTSRGVDRARSSGFAAVFSGCCHGDRPGTARARIN